MRPRVRRRRAVVRHGWRRGTGAAVWCRPLRRGSRGVVRRAAGCARCAVVARVGGAAFAMLLGRPRCAQRPRGRTQEGVVGGVAVAGALARAAQCDRDGVTLSAVEWEVCVCVCVCVCGGGGMRVRACVLVGGIGIWCVCVCVCVLGVSSRGRRLLGVSRCCCGCRPRATPWHCGAGAAAPCVAGARRTLPPPPRRDASEWSALLADAGAPWLAHPRGAPVVVVGPHDGALCAAGVTCVAVSVMRRGGGGGGGEGVIGHEGEGAGRRLSAPHQGFAPTDSRCARGAAGAGRAWGRAWASVGRGAGAI